MDKDLKELSEQLGELREDFDDLEDGLLAQIQVENIAFAEMLHMLWGIAQQGLGACTVLSALGYDIGPEARTKVNNAWLDAQVHLEKAKELSHELAAAAGGENDESDEA